MEIMLAGICPCKARGKHEKNISRCYRTVFHFYMILMLHLSIFINHTVEIGPLHSTPTTSKA